MDELTAWASQNGIRVLLVLLLFVAAWVVARYLSRMVAGIVERGKFDETLGKFFAGAVRWAILGLAVLIAMSVFGVNVTSIAAVLAALGFAIGLAFQGTLSNFAAGVMLLIFRPFKVGDVVKVAGEFGTITEIQLFVTMMDTFDNRRIILPNSAIFGATIENVSFHDQRRIDVNVGVCYKADIDRTREVLQQAVESLENIIPGEGRGTQVLLLELGDSAVHWVVRAWVPASDFWPSKDALTRIVKVKLDEAGLHIPFPQMDVHIDGAVGGYDAAK